MNSHRLIAGILIGLLACSTGMLFAQQPEAASAAAALARPEAAPPETDSEGASKARIVRLSDLPEPRTAEVQIDLNTGNGFEDSVLNMPIVEGNRLQTLRTSRALAEVEFEDLSTLRLTPDTLVEFTQLSAMPGGGFLTSIRLDQGTIYVNWGKGEKDKLTLTVGANRMQIASGSRVRLTQADDIYLAVFNGEVQFAGPEGPLTVGKGKSLQFKEGTDKRPVLAGLDRPGPYDPWDKNQNKFHAKNAKKSILTAGYQYGAADLNVWGSYFDACGATMWQPFFSGANWHPYNAGYWVWYPRAGYTWVSPYPWGWLPYHSGNWTFCSGYGWGWRPSNGWTGLGNGTLIASSSTQPGSPRQARPPQMPGPPRKHPVEPPGPRLPRQPIDAGVPRHRPSPDIVAATGAKVSISGWNSSGLVLRPGSAGLGLPRGIGGIHQLGNLSRDVQRGGAAFVPFPVVGTSGVRSAPGAAIPASGYTGAGTTGTSSSASGASSSTSASSIASAPSRTSIQPAAPSVPQAPVSAPHPGPIMVSPPAGGGGATRVIR